MGSGVLARAFVQATVKQLQARFNIPFIDVVAKISIIWYHINIPEWMLFSSMSLY